MTIPGAAPIPSDVPTSAPIFGDAERGYHNSEEDDPSAPVGATGDRRRNESDTSTRTAVEAGPAPQDDRAIRIKGHGRGLTEGDQDMEELPKNNFLVVMPAIGLVLFLAALDMSIVATALPTIAEQLHATPSEYSWVGTAYTLGMTLQTPLNGRFSDVVGRKPMLQTAILVFTVFSALCGAAKSMSWLIIARAFQGVGGGSIIGLTNIIVSEIVPLSKRPMYQGVLGATWGIASVLGPILGGILTEKVSWRWTFYINLPISGVAFVGLWFSLTLNPTKRVSLRSVLQTFDFLGMFLLMAGGSIFIVGFAIAADHGFGRPDSYALIVVGTVLLGLSVVNFLYTKRNAVIPARMFKNRTTLFFLIGSFLQALAFLPSNYLLPQMFQGVRGAGALDSGVQLLPYAVVVALSTVVAGQINSRLRIVRPVAWFGYGLGAIGFGLFYHFYRYPFSLALQEGLLVVAAIGIGLSLSVPVICIQAAMPLKETGVATTAWSLTRSLGGSVGLALFTAVLNTNLRSKFAAIEGYGVDFQVPEDASGYKALQDLPDGRQKDQVLGAFADSLGLCWIIDCAVLIVALLLTVWTRSYTLNRTGGKQQPSPTTSTELSTDEKLDPQDRIPSSDHEAADLDSDKHDHLESPLSEKILSTNRG